MKLAAFIIFFFVSFNSFSITSDDCERIYENNSLFCSSKYWDKIAQISRKGINLEYVLNKNNRVQGSLKNNSTEVRYVHMRWVLHGTNLEPLMSESMTILNLKPEQEVEVDFDFLEEVFDDKTKITSVKPLSVEGFYIRLRDFEVK